MRRLIAIACLACSCAAQAQQMYRWTDRDGRTHFTQTPPPAGAKNVQAKTVPRPSGPTVQIPYATQQAARNFPVTLYVSDDCGAPCKQARDLLAKRGIPHKVIEVTEAKSLEALKRASGGTALPAMTVGSALEKGFEESRYHAALDAAAYPASGPPVPPEVVRNEPEKEASPVRRPLPAFAPGEEIRLYTAPDCGDPCASARALLAARGAPFREIAVVEQKEFDELQRLAGRAVVPALAIGSYVKSGFQQEDYEAALDAAGYRKPSAAAPGAAARAAGRTR